MPHQPTTAQNLEKNIHKQRTAYTTPRVEGDRPNPAHLASLRTCLLANYRHCMKTIHNPRSTPETVWRAKQSAVIFRLYFEAVDRLYPVGYIPIDGVNELRTPNRGMLKLPDVDMNDPLLVAALGQLARGETPLGL